MAGNHLTLKAELQKSGSFKIMFGQEVFDLPEEERRPYTGLVKTKPASKTTPICTIGDIAPKFLLNLNQVLGEAGYTNANGQDVERRS